MMYTRKNIPHAQIILIVILEKLKSVMTSITSAISRLETVPRPKERIAINCRNILVNINLLRHALKNMPIQKY